MSCKDRLQNFHGASRFTARSRLTRFIGVSRKGSVSASLPSQCTHSKRSYRIAPYKLAKADLSQLSDRYVNNNNDRNLGYLASLSQSERSGRAQQSCQAEATWSDMSSPTHKSDPEDPSEQDGQEDERINKKPRVEGPPAGQEKTVKISGFANVALRSVLKGEPCFRISVLVTSRALQCL
jgi:hypothetical protein